MCYAGCTEDFSFENQDFPVFYCNECSCFFNLDGKKLKWNEAIGNADISYLQTPEQYSDELLEFLEDYESDKINFCLENKFYLEAIIDLHRHIGEQLRFLIIKQIKGKENIPRDNSDNRYNEIVPLMKRMDDDSLIRMSFIYQRLTFDEKNLLLDLNSTRNKFVHAFNKKERQEILSNPGKIKSLVKNCQKIEKRLGEVINDYR